MLVISCAPWWQRRTMPSGARTRQAAPWSSRPPPTGSRSTDAQAGPRGPAWASRRETSGQVEPVRVRHLGPRRDEVADEVLLRVVAGVHLGHGPQLGVR